MRDKTGKDSGWGGAAFPPPGSPFCRLGCSCALGCFWEGDWRMRKTCSMLEVVQPGPVSGRRLSSLLRVMMEKKAFGAPVRCAGDWAWAAPAWGHQKPGCLLPSRASFGCAEPLVCLGRRRGRTFAEQGGLGAAAMARCVGKRGRSAHAVKGGCRQAQPGRHCRSAEAPWPESPPLCEVPAPKATASSPPCQAGSGVRGHLRLPPPWAAVPVPCRAGGPRGGCSCEPSQYALIKCKAP